MSEIFERAAEHVETGKETASCFAVERASRRTYKTGWGKATKWYSQEILCQEHMCSMPFRTTKSEDKKHMRIMALLFAAAIARSEGK